MWVNMALDMVSEVACGKCAGMTQKQRVGRLYQHNPVHNRFCTLWRPKDKLLDFLFPSGVKPVGTD